MTSNICLKLLARIVISDELFLFLHVRVWRAIGKVDGRAQLATEKTDSAGGLTLKLALYYGLLRTV